MEEQFYDAPKSDTSNSSSNIEMLIKPLSATKPWVLLCAILGFIFSILLLLGALAIMVSGGAHFVRDGSESGAAIGIGIAYIIMALPYFFLSLHLFKYAKAIGIAQTSQSYNDIFEALNHQRSFWKLGGVLVLIFMVIFVIGIGSSILLPLLLTTT